MKKHVQLLAFLMASAHFAGAQVFSPIPTSGYNLDAVAENTTALATTGGAIDGSNYVMYSAAYAALYSSPYGLPNNGLVSTGTRTYQLQSYTLSNTMYLMASQSGTITLNTPAFYGGISLLGFSTEGTATFNMVLTFTDNTTQAINNQSFPDWFGTGNTVISGFDRVNRSGTTPALSAGNPKMYYLDFGISCINRTKGLASLSFTNTSTGTARMCLFAVSGTGAPTYSTSSTPVTCAGGNNGSAAVSASGGIPPFTYTWSTSASQTNSLISNVPVGVYSYSVQDNGGCLVTGTIGVTQSLVTQPNLTLTASNGTICSGKTVTLTASGASTYTWASGGNGPVFNSPTLTAGTQSTVTYTVAGLTSVNCLWTGSISILVNPLPGAAWSNLPASVCKSGPALALSNFVQPTGGTFSGQSVASGSFIPSTVGTFTMTYTNTDANSCTNSATTSIQVFSLAAPSIVNPGALCSNASPLQLTVNPTGGNFGGTGVGSTGIFTPAVAGSGNVPVIYSITSGPCTSTAGISIVVNAAPVASVSAAKTSFCKNSANILLNGTPIGGSFSGTGVTGTAFSPSAATIGTNVVVYTFTDINNCTGTANLTMTVSTCAGLSENSRQSAFTVYPNPSRGEVTISSAEHSTIAIFNQVGQQVKSVELHAGNAYQENLTLPAGIYYMQSQDNRQAAGRLVILD